MLITQTIFMKRTWATPLHLKWKFSPIATLLFLFCAAAILYVCTIIVLSFAKNALQAGERQALQPTPSPSPVPHATAEAALDVAAIRTPPVTPTPTRSAPPSTPAPAAVETPEAPDPTPTLLPVTDVPAWGADAADLLLIGMDATQRPEWILAVQIRGHSCRVLSIPKNTQVSQSRRLSDAGSAKTCAKLLTNIWPFRYPTPVTLHTEGLPTFVDQFGGVPLAGQTLNGAEALAYLEDGPTDELLRIERQQAFLYAYLEKLRSLGFITLLSARFAFDPYIDGALSTPEILALLELMRELDLSTLTFHTLPVDSVMRDGVRGYVPDVVTINRIAQDWLA